MFGFFKKKNVSSGEESTSSQDSFNQEDEEYYAILIINEVVQLQSEFYEWFKNEKILNCDDSLIDKFELTLFSSSILYYLYMRFGEQCYRDLILDKFAEKIIEKSLPHSLEKISHGDAVEKYHVRLKEYMIDIDNMFATKVVGNPHVMLFAAAYENITKLIPHIKLKEIASLSPFLMEIFENKVKIIKKM